ncbi:MAG TPA: HAD-IA family hydrolase [Pseudomonadales bacterium]|nr:HAD-IA family hydrolase [Pseudomonadales bacterium]
MMDSTSLDRYCAVIFDMDGTLVDSVAPHLDAWEIICKRYGYPCERDFLMSLSGVPTTGTVEILNQRFDMTHPVVQVASEKEAIFLSMCQQPRRIDPMYHILLAQHRIKPVAVGTGASRVHAIAQLQSLDILPRLSALVTACDVTHGKPHPETFLKAAHQMDIAPSDCIVFEDTAIGMRAAAAAGMDCYRVDNGVVVDFVKA